MAGIFSDALRAPNTQYILSLSYGKDSIACFEAIYRLGLPLDRAVHAEVWATDDIPADLPPMIEFKSHADQIILDRYGIKVEHIYATKPVERERERERERESPTSAYSIEHSTQTNTAENKYMAFRVSEALGATRGLKWPPSDKLIKDTYERRFYKIPNRKSESTKTGVYGFPMTRGNWCTELKTKAFRNAPTGRKK